MIVTSNDGTSSQSSSTPTGSTGSICSTFQPSPPFLLPPPTISRTLAGLSGNILEWYDFAIFGYFSDIISKVFFPPNQTGHSALIESFAVFGGAFCARPIGGILMGYIGDKYGRKKALEVSIFLMAIPTTLMGCLPSYSSIGVWAIVLLILTRLLQGMSVGGQLMASAVFVVEGQPDKRKWGMFGSFVFATANMGTLVGGVVGEIMRECFTEEELVAWAWRIPFLSGFIVAFAGLYLKHYEQEAPLHLTAESALAAKKLNPIYEAVTTHRKSTFCVAAVASMWSGCFYVYYVWFAAYMNSLLEPPVERAFLVNSSAMFTGVMCFFTVCGVASDRVGRRPMMLLGGAMSCVYAPVCLWVVFKFRDPFLSFVAQTFMGVCISMFGGPMTAWMIESFPKEARLSSMSIGYNMAQMLVGGTCPSIATLMFDTVGEWSPGFFISGCCVLGMLGVWAMPMSEEDRLKLSAYTSVPNRSRVDSESDTNKLLKSGGAKSDSENGLEIEMTSSVFVDV
ncbi:hypothetical protein TrVE_jg9304 [Triparma verrucosa]|uniref:Major facilitator superfamily (MFS) profile domain-containing protein n=1 Tax=Triparma verrucosa TaxID=1606542 RepID=A0A9W7FAY1_9STRA|nr:hypothetical protein TrVE_jg9304 [Triparma verrucosa]